MLAKASNRAITRRSLSISPTEAILEQAAEFEASHWYRPLVPESMPFKSPKMSARLARFALWFTRGWRIEGPLPDVPKTVMIAAPHTSNMDGLLLVLLTRSVGMDAKWMVKDTWTKFPIGLFTKSVGAVPVNRSQANGLVGQMVEQFEQNDEYILLVPPEGTRSRAEHWRSGFYRIASEANVPIVPAYVDYSRRRGGFGPPIMPTADLTPDMDAIREYYANGPEMAKVPEKWGPVRLRDED